MGTIVRLTGKRDESLVSLKNLYQSLKDFPECYFATEEGKYLLLQEADLDMISSGYVKLKTGCVFASDIATFIVTDDLCIMPYTSATSIRLLTDLGISDNSRLEEKHVYIGCEQILDLLKMALSFRSVLTRLVFPETTLNDELVVSNEGVTISDQTVLKEKVKSSKAEILLEVSMQKSTGKFIYAEAKEDFVEFLFGYLSIPLGTVIGELMKKGVSSDLTCMDNIFKSITNMDANRYFQSSTIKDDMLLKRHIGQQFPSQNQVFNFEGSGCRWFFKSQMKDPRKNDKFLKKSGMFNVTNDLIVSPSSFSLTMNIVKEMKVSFDDIEKHEVSIGLSEGLKLLKASLRSRSTLTDSLKHQLS
ncbi:hypothetical protein QVD17_27659 [Tagetes erecta]|uniref:Uncharacterized protein n=1 Tax=Tagetes erecta TaxID=13708 RepID=A0AAD8K9G1_TARER|nr:hypothetical protein QVD17_27659 [Tagetes erecta]